MTMPLRRKPRTVLNCTTWIAIFGLGFLALPGHGGEPSVVQTPKDKESYAIGVDMARNIKTRRVQVELEPFFQGMRDVLSGAQLQMSEEDLRKTVRAWQDELRVQRSQTTTHGPGSVAQENLAKGAAFLAQNKTNAGVVTLPSGMQYKILKAGNGPKPAATDTVECHHRSTFIDGRENSSTYLVGAPATIKISTAIAAWKEALPLMTVGSKWQLFIPPQLAYGEKGVVDPRGRIKIGPNSTLICEMELVGIK
jgi:UDP-GlcNAc:undecaprenyl-phosphate/decaprenyl-phosphate GlcNAc-1-phosphate transferase